MRTTILSLNINKSISFTRFQARIESSLKKYTDESIRIKQFEDIKELFVALQSSLENDELIITAVDGNNYLKLKNALIQAFGTEIVYDPMVLNKIENLELDDKQKKDFSAFPEPATVFVSEDGLYSGLAMENGEQYFVLLPIDNNRIDAILRDGIVPYLDKHLDIVESVETTEIKIENTKKVSEAVKVVLETDSLVAVNGTRNAEVLKSCGDNVTDFNKAFVFTPYVEDKGDVNPTEYTAQLAKVSLDLSAGNIGACISDVYTSGDIKYICIAVAEAENALVRKLYISENETESQFIENAALELIDIIKEKASGKRSVGIEINDIENAITEEDKKIAGKKPLAILAIVLGIVIIACSVFALFLNNSDAKDKITNLIYSLVGDEQTTQVDAETTQPAPEITYDEIIKTEANGKLSFSDYIAIQLMNMSDEDIKKNSSVKESAAPEHITVNGEKLDPREALARIVTSEINTEAETETVKAQVVAIYSCLKFLNNGYTINGVQIADSYSEAVKAIVDSVYGEYLTFEGNVAVAPYHILTPGATLDMSSKLPYLKSVKTDGENESSATGYNTSKIFSAEDMRAFLLNNENVTVLSENPVEWFEVKAHDSSISEQLGNVTTISVNGIEMSGFDFRKNILGEQNLLSLCFTITYSETDFSFTVQTYGQGYSLGMSREGANYMALNGSDYTDILEEYFAGTKIAKEAN